MLRGLNAEQLAAVTLPARPALILAGAGSGKTRVLTTRIAWLLQTGQVSPGGLMAVTFTNKASKEMLARLSAMLPINVRGMWIGTFHGLCNRFLRAHWKLAGLPQGFQILDTADSLSAVKRIIKAMQLDEERFVPKQVSWFIAGAKEDGLRPKDVEIHDGQTQKMVEIYQAYEDQCNREGVVDFAELMLRAYELMRDNESLREHYRHRFQHILVDEFQDTNRLQYAWLKMFAGPHGAVFAVGDDDQSIYGFRGALVGNMADFEREFRVDKVIKLEQNYRSFGNILDAANHLIDRNSKRLGKNLRTDQGPGEPVRVFESTSDFAEAQWFLDEAQQLHRAGTARSEIAVLYRSNAQSRVIESALFNAGIPYRVYGGLRFFERAEIKDALAYLRLIASRADDTSFERVVNLPVRGIGARTMDTVRDFARSQATSLWNGAQSCLQGALPQRAALALQAFMALIDRLAHEIQGLELHEQVDHVIQMSGLIEHFKKEKGERGEGRIENLLELVSAARGFSPESEAEAELSPLESFLAHAVLESGEGQADPYDDCVQMMTLHSAKGLEFPVVFLAGMEDGLFPHQRSVADLAGLEEERRLCYVGATRAMRQLYITYAEQRRLYGVDTYGQPSRFIGELPPELVEEIRPRLQVSRPVFVRRSSSLDEPPAANMRMGSRVRHSKFGDGVVLNFEGNGPHARVQVNFERQGTKWLMLSYANLVRVE